MNFVYKLAVGDWSGDGHEKSEDFMFETNYLRCDIIEAYKRAEKLAGVGLTDLAKKTILSDYQDNVISNKNLEKLRKIGVKFAWAEDHCYEDDGLECGPDDVFHLFMEMAATQLDDDFQYKLVEDKVEYINGNYTDFNEMIGYGVY